MKWSDLPLNPTPRMLRQFSGAWLVVFAGLAGHRALLRHQPDAAVVLSAVALLGLIGLVRPAWMRWPFVAATVITFPIGWVVSQLVLLLMFLLVITPVALFMRLRGRDILQLKRPPANVSLWKRRPEQTEPGRYLNQF
jgi:hypothetical protein